MLVCCLHVVLKKNLVFNLFLKAVFQPYLKWDTPNWHQNCKDSGIDFIITDKPEGLREILNKKYK